MPSVVNLPLLGLATSDNPFRDAPAGSLSRADNVVFTSPGVIEPRRGLEPVSGTFGASGSVADVIAFYEDEVFVHRDTSHVSFKDASSTGSFTDLNGNFSPVGDRRVRFVGASRDLFLNALSGVFMVSGPNNPAVLAGMPAPLSMAVTPVTASAWMTPSTAVSYRSTLCSYDGFNRVIEGPASGRTILRNYLPALSGNITRASNLVTVKFGFDSPHHLSVGNQVILEVNTGSGDTFVSGTFTVSAVPDSWSFRYVDSGSNTSSTVGHVYDITRSSQVQVQLPTSVTTATFVRLYRSFETFGPLDVPGDDHFLTYETGFLTGSDVSNRFILINDQTPESLLLTPLYSNPNSGDGTLAANYQPPVADDMCFWQNRMWFSNTYGPESLQVQLIGTGKPSGFQVDDHVTIAGVTYVGDDGTGNHGTVVVHTASDPGTNIEQTAQSLVSVVNAGNGSVYAYYVSSDTDSPGQILLVARNQASTASFSVQSSRATCWSPQLPSGSEFTVGSDDDFHPARLWFSKIGQPEAVPPTNYVSVEADNSEIIRIFPLNYALYFFKTNGIYFTTDPAAGTITKISELQLVAPESVKALGGVLYALTNQGEVRISGNQVVPFSQAIDDDLDERMSGDLLDVTRATAIGVSSETHRRYALWLPSSSSVEQTDRAFVYCTRNNGFTNFTYGVGAAEVQPQTLTTWFALPNDNRLYRERSNGDSSDFQDAPYQVTVTGVSASVFFHDSRTIVSGNVDQKLVVLDANIGVGVGVGIRQGTMWNMVMATSGTTGVYVDLWKPFAPGVATVFNNYDGETTSRVVLSSSAGVDLGDLITVNGQDHLILSVDQPTQTISVLGFAPFDAGSTYDCAKSIGCAVDFNPIALGSPASIKQFRAASLMFSDDEPIGTTVILSSELSSVPSEIDHEAETFGSDPMGIPYDSAPRELIRVDPIPSDEGNVAQLGVGVRKRQAKAGFRFLGASVVVDPPIDTSWED